MARTTTKPKKATKSRRLRSTRRSSASTPTSRNKTLRKRVHQKLATELYSQSLQASRGRVEEAVVEGVSMWPTLRPGYRIQYKKVHPESLSPGELLVLRSVGRKGEHHWRVHRLIGRVGPYFVEAGDNTYTASLVRAEDILGKVDSVRDWKGRRLELPSPGEKLERRFRFFLGCAHAFMFAHECKDRVIGGHRSLALWRLSQAYRAGIHALGLRVPVIHPRGA